MFGDRGNVGFLDVVGESGLGRESIGAAEGVMVSFLVWGGVNIVLWVVFLWVLYFLCPLSWVIKNNLSTRTL